MKIMQAIKEHIWKILTVIFILGFIGRGCSSSKISKTNKIIESYNSEMVHKVDSLIKAVSSLEQKTLDSKKAEDVMEKVMWKFLELEELSDKNHVPINELKYKDSKK
tara:strand:+ start:1020 stop:1340 length:321 start_codon:yes stop_codon:yes gene_type:complete